MNWVLRPSKYRFSPYSLDIHPQQDAFRALRLIRNNAEKWNLNPDKIGMMGFSAGGEVISFVAFSDGSGNPDAEDLVDRENGNPDFVIYIYPGPLGIPDEIPKNAPPAFLLGANDDECCSEPIIKLLTGYREAGVPVETHLYSKGGHAFNMGNRSELKTISSWPERLSDWLYDNGYTN